MSTVLWEESLQSITISSCREVNKDVYRDYISLSENSWWIFKLAGLKCAFWIFFFFKLQANINIITNHGKIQAKTGYSWNENWLWYRRYWHNIKKKDLWNRGASEKLKNWLTGLKSRRKLTLISSVLKIIRFWFIVEHYLKISEQCWFSSEKCWFSSEQCWFSSEQCWFSSEQCWFSSEQRWKPKISELETSAEQLWNIADQRWFF